MLILYQFHRRSSCRLPFHRSKVIIWRFIFMSEYFKNVNNLQLGWLSKTYLGKMGFLFLTYSCLIELSSRKLVEGRLTGRKWCFDLLPQLLHTDLVFVGYVLKFHWFKQGQFGKGFSNRMDKYPNFLYQPTSLMINYLKLGSFSIGFWGWEYFVPKAEMM